MTDSNSQSEEETQEQDETQEYTPISTRQLKLHLKDTTPEMWKGEEEMWAKDEAMELMQRQLLMIAEHVWDNAAKKTEEDGRRTVKPTEVDRAFNEFIHPQALLQEAANKMESLRWQFIDVAKGSPILNYDSEEFEKAMENDE